MKRNYLVALVKRKAGAGSHEKSKKQIRLKDRRETDKAIKMMAVDKGSGRDYSLPLLFLGWRV